MRLPKGNQQVDNFRHRERFPCEIDRILAGANTSYAVGRNDKATKVRAIGNDIYGLLNASQIKLLHEAHVSIDWARVMRIANINLTKWETTVQSPYGKLALELWALPAGKILELSAKAGPEERHRSMRSWSGS